MSSLLPPSAAGLGLWSGTLEHHQGAWSATCILKEAPGMLVVTLHQLRTPGNAQVGKKGQEGEAKCTPVSTWSCPYWWS